MGLRVMNLTDLDLEKKGGLDGVSLIFSSLVSSRFEADCPSFRLVSLFDSSSLALHRRKPRSSQHRPRRRRRSDLERPRRKEEDPTAKAPSLSIFHRTTEEAIATRMG